MAYTIFGTIRYDNREDRLKVLPSFIAHRERCLANEPGTIQFDISLPNDDTTILNHYGHLLGMRGPDPEEAALRGEPGSNAFIQMHIVSQISSLVKPTGLSAAAQDEPHPQT
jgi:hypothetical protein